jgi:hypothetical protein
MAVAVEAKMVASLTWLFFNIHQIAYFVKPLSLPNPSIFSICKSLFGGINL